jgi:hypothetical protein
MFNLILEKNGDSFRWEERAHASKSGSESSSQSAVDFNLSAVDASAYSTHKLVLDFLLELKELPDRYLGRSVYFGHKNNVRYARHIGTPAKLSAHPCSLDKMIAFVRGKMNHDEGLERSNWGCCARCVVWCFLK